MGFLHARTHARPRPRPLFIVISPVIINSEDPARGSRTKGRSATQPAARVWMTCDAMRAVSDGKPLLRPGSVISAADQMDRWTLVSGSKFVAVGLLTGETLLCVVERKAKVGDVFNKICRYLGLKDAELFGLSKDIENEFLFFDAATKLVKIAPKAWKTQQGNGLDSSGMPLLRLQLRIQFYVDMPSLLRNKQTRHHYFLQIRDNVLHQSRWCSDERCFLLGALSLQAAFGNVDNERHRGRYFEPREHFPNWVVDKLGEDYLIKSAPCIHKDYLGVSKSDAQKAFIREASALESPHNVHLYALKKNKGDALDTIWLGVCTRGIEIHESVNGSIACRQLVSTFFWPDIVKLSFERKKFEITTGPRKITYYAANQEKAQHLLYLCKVTHQFNMIMQPRVSEMRRLELQEKKTYKESYVCANNPYDVRLTTAKIKSNVEQRVSVISTTSSNTTSGIVYSMDGSEADSELDRGLTSGLSLESIPFDEFDDGKSSLVSQGQGPSPRVQSSQGHVTVMRPRIGVSSLARPNSHCVPCPSSNNLLASGKSLSVPNVGTRFSSAGHQSQNFHNGYPSEGSTPNSGSWRTLDLERLRSESQLLDLPLIKALCNDRSLVGNSSVQRPLSWHLDHGAALTARNRWPNGVLLFPSAAESEPTCSDI